FTIVDILIHVNGLEYIDVERLKNLNNNKKLHVAYCGFAVSLLLDMLQEENENVLEKAAVEISCEPCVRRHVRSIFMDCAMVSTRPTADGRVSIDANHEFAAMVGKHGINVMMVPRFSSELNVAEVEEQIKVDDVMEVDTITWYNNLSVTCLQDTIREAHEEAVQKALAAFNSMAVGTGFVRQRCEKHLHTFLRKELSS
ncbi:global transcription factor group B1, partial [Tanacetum coccineum]